MDTMMAGRSGRLGRVAMRLAASWLVALLMVGLTLAAAGAQPSPPSYQNDFVQACRERYGTTKRVRSRVVRCTLPDGSTVTCDFNYNPPDCVVIIVETPAAAEGGALEQAEGLVFESTRAAPTGGLIVLTDDEDQR
jgi:hypothetical protein